MAYVRIINFFQNTLSIKKYVINMLAEDYFGFRAKRTGHPERRSHKRTQLSEGKISSRERTVREEEIGLENLRKKYDQIMKKNKRKKKRKTSASYKMTQNNYYHSNKMKYYHYNDEGYNLKTQRVKERVEEKAMLAFQRVKTQAYSEQKPVRKTFSFQRNHKKLTTHRSPEMRLKQKDDFLNIQRINDNAQSVSQYTTSNFYKENSRNLRKMQKQEKQKLKQEESISKYDDYHFSSIKLQSQIEGSHKKQKHSQTPYYATENKSIKEEEEQSMIGLNSKVSDHQSQSKNQDLRCESQQNQYCSAYNENSYDYYAQKKSVRKNIEKSVIDLHSKYSYAHMEKNQENNINSANVVSSLENQCSQSQLCLSNMIAESAKIFNPTFNGKNPSGVKKKQCKDKRNPSKISQESRLSSKFTKRQLKLPKIGEQPSCLKQSKLKLSSTSSKINRGIKKSPSLVKQIFLESEGDFEKDCSKREIFQDSTFSKLKNKKNKNGFNLAESIKMWNYHEKNNSLSGKSKNSRFENVMASIHIHLRIINELSDFVEMTAEMYEESSSNWIELQSFLIYKKFYSERVKIVESLRSGKSCFHFPQAKIDNKSLQAFKNQNGFVELTNSIEQINSMIKKSLQAFYNQIKQNHESESILNLDELRDKDFTVMLNMLNEQFENIVPKLDELESDKNIEDEQIISLRGFRIMEIVFLLSGLSGRRVKKMEEFQIQIDDFEMYCKEYYGQFKETILYFT